MRRLCALAVLLALATPALAGSVRCTTSEVKSLGRLQTLCDDDMWAGQYLQPHVRPRT
jgi:hypothetical protein